MIRVLLIDDSRTARARLNALFASQPDFQVVAQASTREEGLRLAASMRPSLVSLDVFLADSSAAQLVRELQAIVPVPVVLVSDAPRNAPEVFEALAAGALDLLTKPVVGRPAEEASFLKLMRTLSRVRVNVGASSSPRRGAHARQRAQGVVIAASTGGPQALRELLSELPRPFPVPVLVAQHLAHGCEEALAAWLSREAAIPVSVASGGRQLRGGEVLLGMHGTDLELVAVDRVEPRPAPASGYHPSADRLFESAAERWSGAVVGVVLSGIGSDGLRGARRIVEKGGVMVVQDRVSAIVYGMPGAIVRAQLTSVVLRPAELARHLAGLVTPGPVAPLHRR